MEQLNTLDTVTIAIAHTEFLKQHEEKYKSLMIDNWDKMTFSDLVIYYAQHPDRNIDEIRTQFTDEYADLVRLYVAEIHKAREFLPVERY